MKNQKHHQGLWAFLIWSSMFVLWFSAGVRAAERSGFELVSRPNSSLPITVFNFTFRVGSADDPKKFEGLAKLTADLIREGGVNAFFGGPARTRAEFEEALLPYGVDIEVSVAREQTSFRVTSSADDSEKVFDLIAQMLLAPALQQEEFLRLKSEQVEALTNQLPHEDQEELGKAALERQMFGLGHPYSHVLSGTKAGVEAVDRAQIYSFYRTMYTQRRLTVGLAGVISPPLLKRVKQAFAMLPLGSLARAVIPPAYGASRSLFIVKGPFDATGVHLGHATTLNRNSSVFPQMFLASQAFGKHRSFVGRLMKVVRETRGLNYGTYSYVEEFPHGGHLLTEPTQVSRQRQAFTVWARPATLENGCFLTRQVVREFDQLAATGLSKAEFELGQSHTVGNVPLLGSSLERQLAYAIDSKFYGIKGDYLKILQQGALKTIRSQVNAALARHLQPNLMQIVVVTKDPEQFRAEILSPRCSIHYGAGVEKTKVVLEEDEKIAVYNVGIRPEQIKIVDSVDVFE